MKNERTESSGRAKRKNNAARRKIQTPLRIGLPSEADFADLERMLKLTPSQAVALRNTVTNVHAELQVYAEFREKRPGLVQSLRAIEKSFARLAVECGKHKSNLARMLPSSMGMYLGSALSISEFNSILGRDVTSDYVQIAIAREEARGEKITPAKLDQITLPGRETVALKHNSFIFSELISRLHKPFKDWVDLDRQSAGGRMENMARKHLVTRLAQNAQDIIGKAATQSQTSRFADLCEQVVAACGLETHGLDKAIPRILSKLAVN